MHKVLAVSQGDQRVYWQGILLDIYCSVLGAGEGQGDLRDEEPQGRGSVPLQPLEDRLWLHGKYCAMIVNYL